jgi:hypothetical protein
MTSRFPRQAAGDLANCTASPPQRPHAGEHGERVPEQVDVDVLEIVLARAASAQTPDEPCAAGAGSPPQQDAGNRRRRVPVD